MGRHVVVDRVCVGRHCIRYMYNEKPEMEKQIWNQSHLIISAGWIRTLKSSSVCQHLMLSTTPSISGSPSSDLFYSGPLRSPSEPSLRNGISTFTTIQSFADPICGRAMATCTLDTASLLPDSAGRCHAAVSRPHVSGCCVVVHGGGGEIRRDLLLRQRLQDDAVSVLLL